MPASQSSSTIPPPTHVPLVDRGVWRDQVEPLIARQLEHAGPALRRRRARIGPWIIELVSDEEHVSHFFAEHWRRDHGSATPDGYIYIFTRGAEHDAAERVIGRELPGPASRCCICPEAGRAAVIGRQPYARVADICRLLVQSIATRGSRAGTSHRTPNAPDTWLACAGACVEYQPHSSPTRTIAMVGSPPVVAALHSLGLVRCKPDNALVAGSLLVVACERGRIENSEHRLWIPTQLAGHFPDLTHVLAMSPVDGVEFGRDLENELREFRNAADLNRAVESDLLSEAQLGELAERLAHAPSGFALVEPRELLGSDRLLEKSHLTDLIVLRHDTSDRRILQSLPADEWGRQCPGAPDRASLSDWFTGCSSNAQRGALNRLLSRARIRTACINLRLPPAPTQFCIRHYLEGECDSITQLAASDLASDAPLLKEMRLQVRSRAEADVQQRDQTRSAGGELAIYQGMREVSIVAFHKAEKRMEAMALDTAEEGFAQVQAAWPGQVADFFSRHAKLRARELFAELRNSPASSLSRIIHADSVLI